MFKVCSVLAIGLLGSTEAMRDVQFGTSSQLVGIRHIKPITSGVSVATGQSFSTKNQEIQTLTGVPKTGHTSTTEQEGIKEKTKLDGTKYVLLEKPNHLELGKDVNYGKALSFLELGAGNEIDSKYREFLSGATGKCTEDDKEVAAVDFFASVKSHLGIFTFDTNAEVLFDCLEKLGTGKPGNRGHFTNGEHTFTLEKRNDGLFYHVFEGKGKLRRRLLMSSNGSGEC